VVFQNGTKIVFTRYDSPGIWIMNADGTEDTQLTNGRDFSPTWFSNGSKILFTRSRYSEVSHQYTMNSDSTNLTLITRIPSNGGYLQGEPSPDGRFIAFRNGNQYGGNLLSTMLWRVNADGFRDYSWHVTR